MSRAVTLAGYAVVVVAAVAVEVAARRGEGARFGEVALWCTRSPWARLALGVAWLWLGWHFFVRVGR